MVVSKLIQQMFILLYRKNKVQIIESVDQPCSIMPQSPPTNSSNSPMSISLSIPSSTNNYPGILFVVNRKKKEKGLKDHSPLQSMDNNKKKRFTKSQANDIDQIVTRFEKLHFLGDDNYGEPKGKTINYSLISISKVAKFGDFQPSYFEQTCKYKVWVQAVQEDMDSVIKNDT